VYSYADRFVRILLNSVFFTKSCTSIEKIKNNNKKLGLFLFGFLTKKLIFKKFEPTRKINNNTVCFRVIFELLRDYILKTNLLYLVKVFKFIRYFNWKIKTTLL
jgi:hypothetical protein